MHKPLKVTINVVQCGLLVTSDHELASVKAYGGCERTDVDELIFFGRFKVPVHCRSAADFLPFFAGDATQQEVLSNHRLCHGVHLGTAGVAPPHCR